MNTIQVAMPKLKISLYLQPGNHIRDSNRPKLNDPCFEAFANKGAVEPGAF